MDAPANMLVNAQANVSDAEIASLGERGFFVRDALVQESIVVAARAELLASSSFRPAAVGRRPEVVSAVRGDEICWIDAAVSASAVAKLRASVVAFGAEVARAIHFAVGEPDVQCARYPGGGEKYERHLDTFRQAGGSRRLLTAIVYLNPKWTAADGGELRVWEGDAPCDIAPIGGRAVVFLSERVPHEVLRCSALRLAMTAWFSTRSPLG